ncbi:(1-_4)-alpha-D-glucan 1-alpha-D-glucosylmutase [Bosea sp. BE125]|uniref:malto-oligosyltrehalose synthase n=1 Tax=Bosea sp. BE125 TaxID=2817909 RepID=UPI00285811AC|nr:malto-oligosyltrehalose synthase [Bosea sp. BE125]MDR6873086.1 (1->4)-alpha-D-glucan 1-alpha-D-glucosylmutase [Bosea sp. BE125]
MTNAPHGSIAASRSTPNSTYRLQFHKGFPFSAGRDLAAYLEELGVSHVYSSPILTARAGSIHGYDVVDYDAVNPELGGEADFRSMAEVLRRRNIGIILDIVPNHMAVGGADNRLWLDLLKHGRNSAYASWFDVDFDCPDPELNGKVHAPFLGTPLREALASNALSLVAHGSGYAVAYGEHLFPIRPDDEEEIAKAGIAAYRDATVLGGLIQRQNFVLDWWRNAGDRINWRRFFDITQLAAVRMEEPAAFAAKHAVALRLYREGLIDGLRIDHVDGLADPAGYCLELRRQLDDLHQQRPQELSHERAWLIVEKILAPGEPIPAGWDVDGSTGYDFMDQVSAFQHQCAAAPELAANWAAISGRLRDFHGEEEIARHEILSHSFDGQRERLVDALEEAGAGHRAGEGLTRAALRRAVTSLIAQLRAYRSYATGRGDGAAAGPPFEVALKAALASPLNDPPALHLIASVLSGEGVETTRPSRIRAIRRFNQLSAPLAAKAVEDTAFYRYGRLLSRNDVGFDAGLLGLHGDAFHALMQTRAEVTPHAMLATATHDHKRGEDVRARLAVVSEIPREWIAASQRWSELNAPIRPAELDPGDEYMVYQMLIGAWPLNLTVGDAGGLAEFAERLVAWSRKALREAKLRSGWAAPDRTYEASAADFISTALTPSRSAAFLSDVEAFVERVARPGALNGLVQLALRATVPGVPDTYQGTEFWDFSLVDPDNRRPVDFAARRIALSQHLTLDLLAETWRDGRIKQAVLRKLLAFRKAEPELFSNGGYDPLRVHGARAESTIAFMRRHRDKAVLVVAARACSQGVSASDRLVPDPGWWGDTHIALPTMPSHSRAVLGPEIAFGDRLALQEVLPVVPVGVWALRYS